MYKAVIFDMDGTILDTLFDLADSVNHALEAAGYPKRDVAYIRSILGNGVFNLISKALPTGTSEEEQRRVLDIYIPYYEAHCNIKTCLYDGIEELIKTLRAEGIMTAVVSNKDDSAVLKLCDMYFSDAFDAAVGRKDGIRRKPAPDSVDAVINELDLSKKDVVYVGDSEVDIETAENAEIDCIAVTWGFRDEDFLSEFKSAKIARSVHELKALIMGK